MWRPRDGGGSCGLHKLLYGLARRKRTSGTQIRGLPAHRRTLNTLLKRLDKAIGRYFGTSTTMTSSCCERRITHSLPSRRHGWTYCAIANSDDSHAHESSASYAFRERHPFVDEGAVLRPLRDDGGGRHGDSRHGGGAVRAGMPVVRQKLREVAVLQRRLLHFRFEAAPPLRRIVVAAGWKPPPSRSQRGWHCALQWNATPRRHLEALASKLQLFRWWPRTSDPTPPKPAISVQAADHRRCTRTSESD